MTRPRWLKRRSVLRCPDCFAELVWTETYRATVEHGTDCPRRHTTTAERVPIDAHAGTAILRWLP